MKSTVRALILSIAIVSVLTLLFYKLGSTLLIILLYPGLILGLLITGGHGGTHFEENAAFVASILVNTLVYTAVWAMLGSIRQRLRER